MGQVSEIKDQEGNSEYFYYDEEGNLTKHIDRNENNVDRTYNIDKNIVSVKGYKEDKSKEKIEQRFKYKNYEYSDNATHHGRYYEYDTPQGKKVIVEHTNDLEQGVHTHAGEVPNGANTLTYDFKNPDNRYKPLN